jgi:hypothetical protein
VTPRPLRGALALLAAAPRRAAALSAASLALGLALEGLLAAAFGPVSLGAGRPAAPSFWLLGILYGSSGSGIVAWFARWLAAQLVAGWLTSRWYDTLAVLPAPAASRPEQPEWGAAPAPLEPRLPFARRIGPLLVALTVTAITVFAPATALLALDRPLWAIALLAAYPLIRLVVAPQGAVLGRGSGWRAVAASWRLTRRREVFAALYTVLPALPLLALASAVYVAAAYLPVRADIVWWLAVAAYWLYLPYHSAVGMLLWRRLGERADEGEASREEEVKDWA